MMLAGGINQADDLFLHIGFSVLQAISKTGQSRPLHRDADGLIPAQGVALVVLKRLQDAINDKDKIYGVIRSIGLSNNGSGTGFLVPSKEGQLRAMKNAYESAAVNPADVSWIECHATGTPVGDRIEIESMAELFTKNKTHINALKANIGHTITASGAAALLNVLSAFEHQIKPPGRLNQEMAIDLIQDQNFTFSDSPEPWVCQQDYRYAAINNFGFGGNNAHLIVHDWKNQKRSSHKVPALSSLSQQNPSTREKTHETPPVAIVAVGLKFSKESSKKIEHITLPVRGMRFPPIDLENTLGQQLILLELLSELLPQVPHLSPEKTSIFIGMQCDAEIARYSLKWRLGSFFPNAEKDWLSQARSTIMPPLTPAHVIGCMPNIVTNRLNNQFDFRGPSFSVSAEELSGMRGLQIAMDALQNHEVDTAVVGAVDLSCEIVHTKAVEALLPAHKHGSGDMAVMFILKRFQDAKQSSDKIHALLHSSEDQKIEAEIDCGKSSVISRFGYSHAANGLLNVAAVAMGLHEDSELKEHHIIKINCHALGGQTGSILIKKNSS